MGILIFQQFETKAARGWRAEDEAGVGWWEGAQGTAGGTRRPAGPEDEGEAEEACKKGGVEGRDERNEDSMKQH